MKKTTKIFFLIIVIFLLIPFFTNAQKKTPKYLFKIASDAPDNSLWINSIREINREIYKNTGGNVGIVVYPASVMGDQSTVIKKIKIGQLSGATFSSGGLSLIYKDSAILGFPMVFRNEKEYDYVRSKMAGFFENQFRKNGYELLAWSEVGQIFLFSKKKVNSVATLKDSKPLLLEGDNISISLYNEVNTTPVPLQMSDILTGLQTGLIDTIYSSTYALIVTQWFTKVKYMADVPITHMIGAVMVDKALFDSMPQEYQKEMRRLFKIKFDAGIKQVRTDNDNALQALKKAGIIILPVDNKEKTLFYNVCEKAANKLTESEYSRTLLNTIRGHVNDYRKNNK